MLKKGDIILLVITALLSISGYVGYSMYMDRIESLSKIAVIRYEDQTIRRINIDTVDKLMEFTVNGIYNNKILVEKGRIRVIESDCPDQVCVRTGWLTKTGELAVCVPNRLMIKIEGENLEIDGVTH
ncbi:MAG TPA: NusG domain II-containing protein [Clostridiaceae bacterium]|nr:NusG domain II-containing protein [Clostridiaceae bacterium]